MKTWQVLRTLSRILVGLLFVFSGYVKAVDPQGFAIKLGEYFVSLHITFLQPLAFIFTILLVAAELTMGLCLLARVRMRITAWAVLLFMSFFTILTFFIAINGDIVTDCGCFGDAIKLSNWATFLKNIVIFPFVLIIFFQKKEYKPVACPLVEYSILGAFFLFSCGIGLYSNCHLPLSDFMPYKVGTNIHQSMIVPEGMKGDVYKNILIYEKDGKTQEFDETSYPWQDSTWRYVDIKQQLVEKGYTPPIHDFVITSKDDGDITAAVLSNPDYTFILTSAKLDKAPTANMSKINGIADLCSTKDNVTLFAFTASLANDISNFAQATSATYPFYTGDETTLKSMVRSNPGLMLIHNGIILAKWSHADFPSIQQVEQLLAASPETIIKQHKAKENRTNLLLVLAMLICAGSVNFLKPKHS